MAESKIVERGRAAKSKRGKRTPDDQHYAAVNFADGVVCRVEKVPNIYRNITFVGLVEDYAVVGFGTAQHAATLDEAIVLRDRLESEKA